MRCSIRYQLLVPILVVMLGAGGIGTWVAVEVVRASVRSQVEERIGAVARAVGDVPINTEILEKMRGLSGAHFVYRSPEGRVWATSGLEVEAWRLPPPENLGDDWRSLQLGPPVQIGGETYLYSSVRVQAPGRSGGDVLYIFYPESRLREAQWASVRPVLWVGMVGGILSAAVAVLASERMVRRIRAVQRHVRRIAAGDFQASPLLGINDELQQLEQSVNDMAGRIAQLQQAVQRSERFRVLGQVGGGLAHQLRNSVAGARLALQVSSRINSQAAAEGVQVALRQLQLIEEKLRRFLDLGRPDTSHRTHCRLPDLIDEAIELLGPQARHQGITLRWQRPAAGLGVNGDANQLGHLLVNVVGNAIEAAGPGGWVEVSAGSEGGRAWVEVADGGSGPPVEVAGVLFEPFVTSKPDGVGLGLAIARQVVEAHGGNITWRREPDRTIFRIELPLEHFSAGTEAEALPLPTTAT